MMQGQGRVTFDGSKLVTGQRMLNRQSVFESVDPDPTMLKIQMGGLQSDGFGDSEPVPVHEKDEEVISDAVLGFSGGIKKTFHLFL